jgi:hypothetical protein
MVGSESETRRSPKVRKNMRYAGSLLIEGGSSLETQAHKPQD